MTRIPARVAVCQICSTDDVEHNLGISQDIVRRAAEAGATACFLPEASDFIVPTQEQCYDLSQPVATHAYTNGLRRLARELGVWIFVGIHELPAEGGDGRVYNSLAVIDDQGVVRETYRKVHLFDVALTTPTSTTTTGESLRVLPGRRIHDPITVNPAIGPVGLEICYDLRFPEMHAELVDRGAKVLVFPAAFTIVTGRDHWYTLLVGESPTSSLPIIPLTYLLQRATAIQYQVYVLAPAQAGTHYPAREGAHAARSSWGESLAFDPWGRQLGRLESIEDAEGGRMGPALFTVDLDMGLVDSVRRQIPLAIQKRPDVYARRGEKRE